MTLRLGGADLVDHVVPARRVATRAAWRAPVARPAEVEERRDGRIGAVVQRGIGTAVDPSSIDQELYAIGAELSDSIRVEGCWCRLDLIAEKAEVRLQEVNLDITQPDRDELVVVVDA